MAVWMMAAVVVLTVIYEIIGMGLNTIMGAKQNAVYNMVCGYMVYYTVYEVVYLVCLAIRNELKLMTNIWMVVLLLLTAVSLFIARKNVLSLMRDIGDGIRREWKVIGIMGIAAALFIGIYVWGISGVSGESYAYGAVNDAVVSGKLFMRDVYTGVDIEKADMPYALSGYYMHTAMLCRMSGVSAVDMQHNVMGTVSILMSLGVVYLIGRALFKDSSKYVCGLIILYELVNIYLLMHGNERYFLLTGAYDDVTQVPYILIPSIILGYMYILRGERGANGWSIVALCGAAGCALSLSSLTVIPAVILCVAVIASVKSGEYRELLKGVCCMIPCIVYNGLYWICK